MIEDEENHIVQENSHEQPRVPIPVFILFFCIGVAPWLLVNGVWLQMADLVEVTAEHASIAAYLSLSLQFSNIVAFLYVIIQNYRPIPHKWSITFILIFNIITSILFSFLWDKQTSIFGTTHSVALIVLMFFAGMVGCLSVVVLYPWVSLYNVNLTSALSTGMGSSGLLASIIALIERPSDNIRLLSVDWFFRLLGIFLCISFACFVYVIKNDSINKLKTKQQQLKPIEEEGYELVEGHQKETSWRHTLEIFHKAKVCILNQMFICLLSYTLLGILNYSVIGYPNSEQLILWMNILSMVMGTVGRLFSSYYKFYQVTYLSVCQSLVWVFLFVMCIRGAEGLHVATGWIIVVANTLYTTIYGYTDTVIYMKVGVEMEDHVEKAVRFVGLANQIGAFIGSIASFLLAELVL